MSGEPDRVFESCTGTLDDKPAPAEFIAMANVLTSTWKKPGPGEWGNKSHIGHLRYNMTGINLKYWNWSVGGMLDTEEDQIVELKERLEENLMRKITGDEAT